MSAYAEPLGGDFDDAVARVAGERGTTVVAGMFETAPDPGRPFNTLVVRGAATADYRKVHLYDSFGYRESDRLTAGPIDPLVVELGGWQGRADDLLRPALPRVRARPGRSRRRGARGAGGVGRRAAQGRPLATLVRARAIENTVFVAAAAQPGPRYTGHSLVVDPLGDVLAEAAEEPALITATLDRKALDEARRTNPSLANRRL